MLADPVFSSDDNRAPPALNPGEEHESSGLQRLPQTEREADVLQQSTIDTQLLTGLQASRSAVLGGALAGHDLLHFATHGLFNDSGINLSGLALSAFNQAGEPEPWLLTARDISGLSLDARLAVLSACDTARGELVAGEGLLGLVRAFQYAGVNEILASTWKVSDAATAQFIEYFYQALLEEERTTVASLQFAQQQMQSNRRWRDPYFWAGFKLIGNT